MDLLPYNISDHATGNTNFLSLFAGFSDIELVKSDSAKLYFIDLVCYTTLVEHDALEDAKKYPYVVFFDLFNMDDDASEYYKAIIRKFDHPNKIWLTINKRAQLDGVKVIYWDLILDRSKAYYYRDFDVNRGWYYASKQSYVVPELHTTKNASKIFLSPSRRALTYRTKLSEFLKPYRPQGYVSAVHDEDLVLESEDSGCTWWDMHDTCGGLWVPLHRKYYADSYFSVYVESNYKFNDILHITEKTYEPLLRGHFILPFSSANFVESLREVGFKFPNEIDYSYDSIDDVEERFQAMLLEFQRLMTMDWSEVYAKNYNLLRDNQSLIKNLPYGSDLRQLLLYN